MNKNRELALRLGIPWHELQELSGDPYHTHLCSCGRKSMFGGGSLHCDRNNPNFSTPDGIVLLLTRMREREDWHEFICCAVPVVNYDSYILSAIHLMDNYILDTTGKLRDAALAFLSPVGKEHTRMFNAINITAGITEVKP